MHFPLADKAYKGRIKNGRFKIDKMFELPFHTNDQFFIIVLVRVIRRGFNFFASATDIENILKVSVMFAYCHSLRLHTLPFQK